MRAKSRARRSMSRNVVKSRAIQTFPFFEAETTVKLVAPSLCRAPKTASIEIGSSSASSDPSGVSGSSSSETSREPTAESPCFVAIGGD